jgi:hypothetical protein
MAANTSPIFALSPELAIATVTTATTDRTGATMTNTVTLLTAATNGTKITQIGAKVALAPITASTTVTSQRAVTAYSDLQLKAGQVVKVGTTVATAAGVNVFAVKGDY